MKRKKLNVCYDGSGVHSLRGWATFFIIFSIIGVIITIIGFVNYSENSYSFSHDNTENYALIVFGVSAILTGLIFAPILRGLATIAETALIQKHIFMLDFHIVQSNQSEIVIAHKIADFEKEKVDNDNRTATFHEPIR
jgi:hypothetical protein